MTTRPGVISTSDIAILTLMMNRPFASRTLLRTPSACLVCSGLVALLCGPAAHADIYRWTNEHGEVVYSNVAPVSGQATKNVTLVTRSSTIPAQPPPSPTQHELLARIQTLEQQLQAQQSAPPVIVAPPVPAAPPPVVYIQSAPAPAPALTYYDNGWADGYDRTWFSPLFPSLLPTSIITVSPFFHGRSPFARRGGGRDGFHGNFGGRGGGHGSPGRGHGGGMHRGR